MNSAFGITVVLLFMGVLVSGIPSLPVIPVMLVISIFYGFVTHFQTLHGWEWILLIVLTLLAVVVDYSAGLLGAKFGGAHKKSLLYGFMGTLAGTVLLPPFGGFLGLFLGIVAGEMVQHGRSRRALKAATSSVMGSIIGQIGIVILACSYLVLFIILAKS